MSDINSNLGHSFQIQTISPKVRNIDCSINVVKRREQVFYSSSLSADAVGIAFTSAEPLTSDTNVSIADRSTSLAGNRVQEIDYTTLDSADTFTIDTDTFVVTDIFVTEENTITPEPLFYQHIISTEQIPRVDISSYDYSLDPAYKLITVEILDNAFQPIKVSEKYIDYATGIVYSNLQTSYDSSIDYTLYYIKYTFSGPAGIFTLTELMDTKPVYRIATYDDLNYLLQIIPDGRKVYLLEDQVTSFSVTLPSVSTYAFKPLAKARLKVLSPVSSDAEENWFVRISNGKFFQQLNGSLFKYYIAEFLVQSFVPEAPIKHSQLELSEILTKNLIKLDRENIKEDTALELYVELQINKSDGSGVAAFTTDPNEIGNIAANGMAKVRWNSLDRLGIKSVDHSTGFVDIEGLDLKSTWTVEADYYFEETNYEFTLFNFNPINNNDALTHKVVFFIDPETGVTKSQTLYYLKVDQSGKVVESNWDEFDNTNKVYNDSQPLYYETYPTYLDPVSHHLFINEFSVEGLTVTSGLNTTNFLVLGDVTTAEAQHVRELTKIDSRRRGGGIKESEIDSLIDNNIAPEAQWCWDVGYWDGIPYPGNASLFVEVPVDIMEDEDTGFTHAQVRDIVSKHIAAGVYPVIRGYGVDIQVTGIIPTEEGLVLEWYSDGFGY